MWIVKFQAEGRVSLGTLSDGQLVEELDERQPSIGDVLETHLAGKELGRSGRRWPVGATRLLAPVDDTARIFAAAQNYLAHAAELGGTRPPRPVFFLKLPSTLAPPDSDVPIPRLSTFFDYEGELGVLIGRRCRDVRPEDAHTVIGGYTVCNDASARDLQPTTLSGKPMIDWFSAKTLDGSSPVGPWIVTPEDIGDATDLDLLTVLNGEAVQHDRTSSMIFSVAELIAFLSTRLELRPGDLIETGTPGGVGAARGRPLRHGDRLEIRIERVGVLRNHFVREGSA